MIRGSNWLKLLGMTTVATAKTRAPVGEWKMNAGEKFNCGSLDHEEREEQMAAVDAAMRHYFRSEDWIRARAREFPGLKRVEIGQED